MTQPEALRPAYLPPLPEPDMCHRRAPDDPNEDYSYSAEAIAQYGEQCAAAELRRQHAEIERLRAALEALMLTANQAQIDMAAQDVLVEWQGQMQDAVVKARAALEQTKASTPPQPI